jgi:hypothetical protein
MRYSLLHPLEYQDLNEVNALVAADNNNSNSNNKGSSFVEAVKWLDRKEREKQKMKRLTLKNRKEEKGRGRRRGRKRITAEELLNPKISLRKKISLPISLNLTSSNNQLVDYIENGKGEGMVGVGANLRVGNVRIRDIYHDLLRRGFVAQKDDGAGIEGMEGDGVVMLKKGVIAVKDSDSVVTVRKDERGNVRVEGLVGNMYYRVRDIIDRYYSYV